MHFDGVYYITGAAASAQPNPDCDCATHRFATYPGPGNAHTANPPKTRGPFPCVEAERLYSAGVCADFLRLKSVCNIIQKYTV